MPEARIDVSGLWGAVEGYAITALESPRASITMLSRHFGFDAVEIEGVIRFIMRGRASVATLGCLLRFGGGLDDLVLVVGHGAQPALWVCGGSIEVRGQAKRGIEHAVYNLGNQFLERLCLREGVSRPAALQGNKFHVDGYAVRYG